jgi:hypothetical protein
MHGADEVHAKRVAHDVLVEALERDAGVVHEHVDAARTIERRDETIDARVIGDIEHLAVGADDLEALLRERRGDRFADATVRSGHDGELLHALVFG